MKNFKTVFFQEKSLHSQKKTIKNNRCSDVRGMFFLQRYRARRESFKRS